MNVCKKNKEGGGTVCERCTQVYLKMALGNLRNYSNHQHEGGLYFSFTYRSILNAENILIYLQEYLNAENIQQITLHPKNFCWPSISSTHAWSENPSCM